jgi:hypothetical protein
MGQADRRGDAGGEGGARPGRGAVGGAVAIRAAQAQVKQIFLGHLVVCPVSPSVGRGCPGVGQ